MLFEVVLDVDAHGDARPRFAVAAVFALAAAADEATAIDALAAHLTASGERVVSKRGRVRAVPASAWIDYVREHWPRQLAELPTADAALARVRDAGPIMLSYYPHD